MIWKRGGGRHILGIGYAVGKITTPIIMYGHTMAEGGGELKIV